MYRHVFPSNQDAHGRDACLAFVKIVRNSKSKFVVSQMGRGIHNAAIARVDELCVERRSGWRCRRANGMKWNMRQPMLESVRVVLSGFLGSEPTSPAHYSDSSVQEVFLRQNRRWNSR